MRTAWDVLQDNTAQYSQSPSGPPTLGSAVGGLLSDWTDFASNNIEESFPWITENDPKAIGKSMLESLFGAGRISRAESEAMGAWHGIGAGKRLDKVIPGTNQTDIYVPEMNRVIEGGGLLHPYQTVSPEALQGGNLIPLIGDKSQAGGRLTHIGDTKLPSAIDLSGGNQFMQNNPEAAWASNAGVIAKLQNAAQESLMMGQTPYGVFMPMDWKSMDFNHMMLEGLLGQMKVNGVSPTTIKKLGVATRAKQKAALASKNADRKRKGKKALPQSSVDWWQGGLLGDGDFDRMMGNSSARSALMEALSLKDVKAMRGIPDIAETRYAVADPKMLHTPAGHGGQNISTLTGETVGNPSTPHRSYDTQLERDQYIGGVDTAIPLQYLFPDHYARRRLLNEKGVTQKKKDAADIRSMTMRSIIPQPANQEWLDGVMGYVEKAKQGLL